MRLPQPFLAIALLITSIFSGASTSWGQDDSDGVARMRTLFRDIASRYQIRGTDAEKKTFELIDRPVLNWSNPERRTDAGAMFLWTDAGRPKAAMCIYPRGPAHFEYEFQSLAANRISADGGGGPVWEPNAPGMTFRPLKSEVSPGSSKTVRTRQFRALAREFDAKLKGPGRQPVQLRMLTAPVYRYGSPDELDGVIGGAVFAFVQGTDPEAILIIEAVRTEAAQAAWQYGFARMSVIPTEVYRQAELAWQSTVVTPNRYSPYFVMRRVERDDARIISFE